jgi:hypothetical protein
MINQTGGVMQKQIIRISPFQCAKVSAVLYFIITIPFVILFALAATITPGSPKYPIVWLLFAPVLYAVLGFIFCIIGAWIYNGVAKLVGGFEYTSIETRDF